MVPPLSLLYNRNNNGMFLIQSFGEDPNESKSGNMLTHMEEIKIWIVGTGELNHMFLIFSPQFKGIFLSP